MLKAMFFQMMCKLGLHEWVYLDPVFPRGVSRNRVHYPKKCVNCMKEVQG